MSGRTLTLWVAVLAAPSFLLMAAYVGGYFWLGTVDDVLDGRSFPNERIARLYVPVVRCQSWVHNKPIYLGWGYTNSEGVPSQHWTSEP